MLLRILIGMGALLMLAGFGAAGWQYWQSLPPTAATEAAEDPETLAAATARPQQNWLISQTGGLVGQNDAQSYLDHARFVEGRTVEIVQKFALNGLLVDGEKLPEEPYLQVLADIRAPKVAAGACAALLEVLAADCALHSARVVEDSVDPVAGVAEFRLVLAYTLKPFEDDLPDLSARAFATEAVGLSFEAGTEGAGTVGDLIRSAVVAAEDGCAAQRRTEGCRVMRMSLKWEGDGAGSAMVEIGSLSRLPKGMYPAPPLG